MDSKGSVLIIDDEANLRQTLTRILHQAGCEVTTAADGAEARRRLADNSYNLVYLDLRLPDMSGLQILKEIRVQNPKIPVILLTAYGSLHSALEALHLGASDYLLKPIDPEILVARTRVVLAEQAIERRKRELQEQIHALQTQLRELDSLQPSSANTLASPAPQGRFLKRGKLILDLHAWRATLGEQVLALPPTTFEYLVVLARHAPDVVDYRTLVAEAQGYQVNPAEARELAKWHIHVIRQSFEPEPQQPRHVLNVRGAGYRLLLD